MPKPTFPTRGQKSPNFWDDDLKAYVDYGTSLVVVEGGTVALEDTYAEGETVGYLVKGTATFTGEGGEIEVEAGVYTFVRIEGGWNAFAAAEGTPLSPPSTEVTDPPTQPGAVTVDPSSESYNLTWVASTVALGYEGSVDGSSIVDYGSNLSEVVDAAKHPSVSFLPGSSHSGFIRSYNSLGDRSTSRNWGPVSLDTVPVHDLILSLEPEIYLRFTEGEIEDLSRVPGVWVASSGATAFTDFNGPPLTPGDTGSLKMPAGQAMQRPQDDLLAGATSFTCMAIVGVSSSGVDGNPHEEVGGLVYDGVRMKTGTWGNASHMLQRAGSAHTWFGAWSPALWASENPTLVRRSFENSTSVETVAFNKTAPLGVSGSPLGLHTMLVGQNNPYVSHLVVFKDVVLDTATRTALCTAASTLDNAATGSLP